MRARVRPSESGTLPGYRTDLRKAKLEVGGKPLYLELESRLTKVGHYVLPVDLNKVRQHEAVVQRGPPPYEFPAVWRFPETCRQRPHQQLLRKAHLRVRRHLKSAQLHQSKARSGGVRRVELVDAELGAVRVPCQIGEKMTKYAIGQPQRTSRRVLIGDLVEGDFQFVDGIRACLVHARMLTGGTDEQSREQIGQGRVIVPVSDQASQQIGTPQERTVFRSRSAQHNVVSAAGPGVLSIDR